MKSIRIKMMLPLAVTIFVVFASLLFIIDLRVSKEMRYQFMSFAKNTVDGNYALLESTYDSAQAQRNIMMGETEKRLTQLTESVSSSLSYLNDQVENRSMTLRQAQEEAKEMINGIRYGKDGYFWVDNTDYILQVLPPNPSAVGMDRENLTDINGKKMVKELVDGAVKNGSVFVEYWFPKLDNGEPFPKLGRALLFEPWNWVIGTGEYIDNIDAAAEEVMQQQMQKLNELMYKETYFDSYGFIKTREGEYLAYVDQSRIGEISDSKDVKTGASLNELYFSIKNGPVEYYFTKDGKGEHKKIGYVRYFEPLDAVIVYTIYEDAILEEINTLRFVFVVAGLLSFILIAGLSYMLLRSITKPILKTTAILQDISEGEGDLTQRIDVKTDDEVGQLALHFNTFMEKLSKIIHDLNEVSARGKDHGEDLASNTTEISSSTIEMSATMNSLNDKTEFLSEKVSISTEKVEEIKKLISTVNENIDNETAFIDQSSAAITEMVASIQNLSKISQDKNSMINELIDHSQRSGADMEETAREIIEISNSVDTILELVVVINGVSDQINLLSMNAAIEAAHAGDAGKGFAVVAEEIRKLAETTNEQSARITQSVHEIAERINASGTKSQQTVESITYINNNIKQIADTMNELIQGMTEISEGSKQITDSLDQLVSSSVTVRDSANSMDKNSDDVLSSIKEVKDISTQNLNGIKELTIAAEQITNAIQMISDMGNSNKENIDQMDRELSRFKID